MKAMLDALRADYEARRAEYERQLQALGQENSGMLGEINNKGVC